MKVIAKIEFDVEHESLWNLLCCALEGGSNYWYFIKKFIKPKTILNGKGVEETNKDNIFRHLDYPMSPGGALIVVDRDEPEGESWTLNRESIKKGIQTMADKYPKHFMDFINENEDAITGDVFLQCCLFEELVYG